MGVNEKLLEKARAAAQRSYSPYSEFPVGASVVTENGDFFDGCNIENASYGLTICAERVAIFNAISSGARKLGPLAVSCLKGDPENDPNSVMPCGSCLQVMTEFMPEETPIIIDKVGTMALKELLPLAFRLNKS